MKTITMKTKKVTGFGSILGYDTIAMMRFDRQLSRRSDLTELEKYNVKRLYYCIHLGYLTQDFRYNRKHYSALADNLGLQHNTRKMIEMVQRSELFEISPETDKYGLPLWFYSPLMHRETPNIRFGHK